MSRTAPELGEVQETLLIPLYARACDAASRRPVLGDRRARELVDAIDYDFSRFVRLVAGRFRVSDHRSSTAGRRNSYASIPLEPSSNWAPG